MADISLSRGVRSNLLTLQNSATIMSEIQNRLATGKRVNSALDNPANFFTSAALNARGNDLSALLDSMSNSVKVLEAADQGIKSLTKLVESAKSVANQALAAGSNANGTHTGTTNITGATAFTAAAGNIVLRSGASGPLVSFAVTATTTVQQFMDSVNNSATGFKAELITNGANVNIKLSTTSGTDLTIDASSTDTTAAILGVTEATYTATANASTERAAFAVQFDALRTQIDQLAKDAGFNGKNLLNGDTLTVTFNEKAGASQSKLDITGVTYSATGLGVAASTNNFKAKSDINTAITNVTNAVTSLRTQASTFGSNLQVVLNRQDFTKSLINTLKSGADNLVLADTNEEGANLLALQTRQSLSVTALSLSAQQDQAVLRLFG